MKKNIWYPCDRTSDIIGNAYKNVYRKRKSVHVAMQQFCDKQNNFTISFFTGRNYRGIFRKTFTFKYLLSMPFWLVLFDKYEIYYTKNTNMNYISKYNFYKMMEHTHTCMYIDVNYLRRDGCLPSRGRNSRRLFFIVSLFSPSCVRMCTCLPIAIFLRLSFRLS